jgi:hypothetical protein
MVDEIQLRRMLNELFDSFSVNFGRLDAVEGVKFLKVETGSHEVVFQWDLLVTEGFLKETVSSGFFPLLDPGLLKLFFESEHLRLKLQNVKFQVLILINKLLNVVRQLILSFRNFLNFLVLFFNMFFHISICFIKLIETVIKLVLHLANDELILVNSTLDCVVDHFFLELVGDEGLLESVELGVVVVEGEGGGVGDAVL